jgi:hypothetical protein
VKLYAIVEGHGEVTAVPVLLRRMLHEHAQCFDLAIGIPIRRKEAEFRREADVQNAVRLAMAQPECAAVLLLFDGEDVCPVERGAEVRRWAKAAAGDLPCEVVVAYREFETWFLSSVESLRGYCKIASSASSPANPEAKRDAKGALEEFMPPGASYSPTVHQHRMSAVFDMAQTHRRSRSFRKLTKAVGDLLCALGRPVDVWPPPGW